MKTKKLTFLLSLTFLFLFSGSSVVFADDLKDGIDAGNKGDFKTAYKLLYPLAEQGNAEAQFFLGSMYDEGKGVSQDYKEAVRLFRLSAEQGDASAEFNMGVMYSTGRGVPKDYKEAVKWFRLSAEQGLAQGQYIMGLMYDDGNGVPQDYVLAYMWLSISSANGDKDAVTGRNIVEKKMSKQQIEKAQELVRNWKPPSERIKIAESPPTIPPQPPKSNGEEPEVKREYWDNGKLKSEEPHNGLATWWYETGEKEREGHFKNGKRDGLTTKWYETGEKEGEGHFKNGERDGLTTKWYKTGGKKIEGHFKNGKVEGLTTTWFETGEKQVEVYFKNGKAEGLRTDWDKTGKKKSTSHYKNGIEHRIKKEWNEDGKLIFQGNFIDGVNDNEFDHHAVQGLTPVDSSENFIEYKRSFCGQYWIRIIRPNNIDRQSYDSEDQMKFDADTILAENPNLIELPTYGNGKLGSLNSIILFKKNTPLIGFNGIFIGLRCEDITSDGKPELFVDINYMGGMHTYIQYIFSMDKFNLLLDTIASGVTWYDGGLHQKMEDLDGDGVKEYNGWRSSFDLVGVCRACKQPPRVIMCLNDNEYVDCTMKFPELLQQDINESRKRLRSRPEYFKKNIDALHTELIFQMATSSNLNKEEETLDYIKTNFSKETVVRIMELFFRG